MAQGRQSTQRKTTKGTRKKTKDKHDVLIEQPLTRATAHGDSRVKNAPRVKTDKQITVHLENKPGELARLTTVLEKHGVNIVAMTVSEMADTGAVRMVVDNRAAAKRALDAAGLKHTLRDVVLVRAENSPGALGFISTTLAKNKINMDYAYASALPDYHSALIVIACNHTRDAARVLK